MTTYPSKIIYRHQVALTGFDLTAYLSWICYFSYYVRVKIYSYLSLLIFNNLIWHYYHPINFNLVCSVGRLFLINRIGSIINYSYNHYWTTRLCFYLFQKDQIKIITFSLFAVNCIFIINLLFFLLYKDENILIFRFMNI